MTTIRLNYFLDGSVNNLAKFGYILDVKVEKKTESFYIFGCLLELNIKSGNLDFLLEKSGKCGSSFP